MCTRGTSNSNQRGSSYARQRRREWLVQTYQADVVAMPGIRTETFLVSDKPVDMRNAGLYGPVWRIVCRCYRCGCLLTTDTVSADRIIPGCDGGTYRRNNIRPACLECQSTVGGGCRRKSS